MTPPLRVMRPFFEDNFTEVMIMSSSPGLLEGDTQIYDFNSKSDTKIKITSQSYEKIHPMSEVGLAKREINIKVEKNATLICKFLPAILYKDSNFKGKANIELEDDSSKLIFIESFAAGRVGRGESFLFRGFKNSIKVKLDKELVFFENNHISPSEIPYKEIGFFEEYDHFTSICMFNFKNTKELNQDIYEILKNEEKKLDIRTGISSTFRGDMQIRILGKTGQDLLQVIDLIINYAENILNKGGK
ncbi:urease accessory protein UreD [Campylobacter blaseri]|nr:urease accessory protein UreD [Campylobacter blaseri]